MAAFIPFGRPQINDAFAGYKAGKYLFACFIFYLKVQMWKGGVSGITA
jgi:hypothetical protein